MHFRSHFRSAVIRKEGRSNQHHLVPGHLGLAPHVPRKSTLKTYQSEIKGRTNCFDDVNKCDYKVTIELGRMGHYESGVAEAMLARRYRAALPREHCRSYWLPIAEWPEAYP